MALKVTGAQLAAFLDTDMASITPYLFLRSAAGTPADNSVIGDFYPPSYGWMYPQLMTGLTPASLTSGVASVTWDPVVFTNATGTARDVYGYGVCDSLGSVLYWAENEAGAPISVPPGATYTVFPYYERKNEP